MGDIVMPRLSDTMEEGTILRWLKADGEHVARGEDLVEIETDKATMNYPSDQEGILRTLVDEGETLAVGARIAWVGTEEQAVPEEQPGARAAAREEEPAAPADGPASNGAPAAAPVAVAAPASAPGERVKASPLARRLARARGIDLGSIAGTGPAGRIVRADVDAALAAAPAATPSAPAEEPRAPARTHAAVLGSEHAAQETPAAEPDALALDVGALKGETTVLEGSRMQRAIARRMAESKATIPDFTLAMDVDMEACVQLRGELAGVGPVVVYGARIVSPDAPAELYASIGALTLAHLLGIDRNGLPSATAPASAVELPADMALLFTAALPDETAVRRGL